MMRWIAWSVVSLTVFIGGIVLVGYVLPVGHQVSRSAEFSMPPDRVFALMSDLTHYRSWWDGATVTSEVVESVPPSRLVTKVVGETDFGGTWTIEIEATPTGSRMTITERGEVFNPVFRVVSKFVFGHASTIEGCLEAAKKKLAA